MQIIYKIIILSLLMSVLYAFASMYDEFKSGAKKEDMKEILVAILFNMIKIIIVFSLVCIVIIFLFLGPIMKLIS